MMVSELKEWFVYNRLWRAGLVDETNRPKFSRKSDSRQFAPDGSSENKEFWHLAGKEDRDAIFDLMEDREREALKVGLEFIEATRRGKATRVQELAQSGFNVNFRHPSSGATALHLVASGGSKRLLRSLLTGDNVDYLVKDKRGRLPSILAAAFNPDPTIARFLEIKERQQASAQGLDYHELRCASTLSV